LGIAQALLGKPRLLILDEPTNGLDPVGIRELREFVRTLVQQEQIGVLISSHLLSEIQMMCDRVAIIHHGRLIKVATVQELVEQAIDKVEWKVDSLERAEQLLRGMKYVADVRRSDEETLICRMPLDKVSDSTKELVEKGIKISMIRPVVVTLEDLFIELTGGEQVG
jgi:ABC-2 type transport system ATP-binding protein